MKTPPNTAAGNPARNAKTPDPSDFPLSEVLIVAIYLVLAALWIVFSDLALDWFTDYLVESLRLQTYKGLNFVLVTSVLLYVVLRRNFTRRRRAEKAAGESAERFELVARASNDAIWDWDLKTDVLWWGQGFTTLFGYEKDEVDPTIASWTERLHPEDRERVLKGIRNSIDSRGRVWFDEYRFQRKDSSYAFVFDKGFVIRDDRGNPVRMVGGISDVTERRTADEKIRRSQQQLRALSARLQSLREEEQKRIAREIHDELGQMLTALKMDLRWVEDQLSDSHTIPEANPILDRVVAATELADNTIATVQKIAAELRPGILDSLGLVAALKHEAARFQERAGIPCELNLPEPQPALSPEAVTAVFRIFQETLTNVARHANATRIQIDFKAVNGHAVLTVSDNGKGIGESALVDPNSLGLLGMQERAMLVGGEIAFGPGEERGTTMTLRVPLFFTQPDARP